MSITLEPKLQTKLDRMSRRLGKSVDEIADEAIRRHLEELDVRALEVEDLAYRRLFPDLRQRYSRQYVAIHSGRVTDADPDFEALYMRVQEKYGDRAVLIRRVGDSPEEEYRFRSPRLE